MKRFGRRVVSLLSVCAMLCGVSVAATASNTTDGYSYLKDNGDIDYVRYFDMKQVKASLSKESVDFVLQGKEAEVTFKKELAADNFGISFAGVKKNQLQQIEVELSDAENPEQKVAVIIDAMNETSSIVRLRNTKRSYIITGSLNAESNYDFVVSYNAERNYFTDNVNYNLPIVEFDDGNIFTGFESHKANVTIRLKGEKGSIFRLKEINRQRMGSLYAVDSESPEITILNYKNKAVLGSVITLPKAFAMDVLADSAKVTMRVEDPERNPAKATDGTELTNVDPSKDYKIKIEKNGNYRVLYQATDGRNETREISRVISAMDRQAPEIQLNEELPTQVKVGEKFTLPEATYNDNVTESTDISGWTTVKYPSGVILDVKNEVTFATQGNYVISFLAVDTAGNLNCVSTTIYAEGE